MKFRNETPAQIPLEYLLECSKSSLNSFLLAQLNKSANSRKEMKDVMAEWIEAWALALFAEWLIVRGEELVALAASSVGTIVEPELPNERAVETKRKHELWRSEQGFRKARRAG
jgi:hypothetical protein